ncbi:hypothetical protein LTR53_001248 [Teratosphaeriaceae sp. CCFEE 6253]|nr:hypothetical protein LTR53_001248 [Teratosphaeriaceae sp. CCFEE 6253]
MGSMDASQELKNIILIGPGGSLGSTLLNSLLSEPSFTVSVLVRESSSSIKSLPSGLKVHKIGTGYPKHELLEAFKGQDAVVSAVGGGAVLDQLKFIDASIEAGVKRFVASEYGLNNMRPAARALNQVFGLKADVQDYLRSKESTGLTWHVIGNGMWIDWALQNSFLGLDYANRTVTLYDDGNSKFSTSTMANTALALNRSLLQPEKSKNQAVYISDFATTQAELVDAFEKISGEPWTRQLVHYQTALDEANEKLKAGDPYAVYKQIEIGFASGRYGAWLEEKEKIWNEDLGLPKQDKDDVLRKALKSVAS